MPDAPPIQVDHLTKRFGKLTAVSDLNLEVGRGEIAGFLGPNGAGKTTTIRVLMGFINPTTGTCSVLGGSSARQPALRRRIGYLPGDFRADADMTGAELLQLFADVARVPQVLWSFVVRQASIGRAAHAATPILPPTSSRTTPGQICGRSSAGSRGTPVSAVESE